MDPRAGLDVSARNISCLPGSIVNTVSHLREKSDVCQIVSILQGLMNKTGNTYVLTGHGRFEYSNVDLL